MTDGDAKTRILKATMALMDETPDSDKITIRDIAARAGVGVGLINYHFQTREKLLYTAIGDYMVMMIEAMHEVPQTSSPAENLKGMLKTLCDVGMRYEKQMRIGAQYDLMQGDMSAVNYLLPLLRQMHQKDETVLRVMAFEIIAAINLALLRNDVFFKLTGLNVTDKAQRDQVIDIIVNQYL
jgi:AcrR family transcriptional regulator